VGIGEGRRRRTAKLAVAGAMAMALALALAVQALAAAGQLDPTFSKDGRVLTTFPGGGVDDEFKDVAADGKKVVAAGISKRKASPDTNYFAVARYTPHGKLDKTFAGDGGVVTKFPGSSTQNALAVAVDGKRRVVVAGTAEIGTRIEMAVARFLPNGSLDKSFSGDGRRTIAIPGGTRDDGNDVAVDSKNRIVVGGRSYTGGKQVMGIARLKPNGAFDKSFAGDGTLVTEFPGTTSANVSALTVAGKKIVAVGEAGVTGGYDFAVARYRGNGSLDPKFSGDGRLLQSFPGSTFDIPSAVAVDHGKVIVGGNSNPGKSEVAVARFKADGTPDPKFSGDGLVLADFPSFSGTNDAEDLALEGKKIVLGGSVETEVSVYGFALMRFKPNGSLDKKFSGDGRQTFVFLGGGVDDEAYGLIATKAGITAAGYSQTDSDFHYAAALARVKG
jgi:uncharacterized delta-60 repeat protein